MNCMKKALWGFNREEVEAEMASMESRFARSLKSYEEEYQRLTNEIEIINGIIEKEKSRIAAYRNTCSNISNTLLEAYFKALKGEGKEEE